MNGDAPPSPDPRPRPAADAAGATDAAAPAGTTAADVAIDDDVTGLPALRSWRAVYAFVVAVFVAYVVLLTALSRAFS